MDTSKERIELDRLGNYIDGRIKTIYQENLSTEDIKSKLRGLKFYFNEFDKRYQQLELDMILNGEI